MWVRWDFAAALAISDHWRGVVALVGNARTLAGYDCVRLYAGTSIGGRLGHMRAHSDSSRDDCNIDGIQVSVR